MKKSKVFPWPDLRPCNLKRTIRAAPATSKREDAVLDLHIYETSARLNIAPKLKDLGVCWVLSGQEIGW